MPESRGFAILSPEQRQRMATKGGQAASRTGKKHSWSPQQAKEVSAKGVAARKKNAAVQAALKLMSAGFKPDELTTLKLSNDEWIYYGGKTATLARQAELRERIINSNVGTPIVPVESSE